MRTLRRTLIIALSWAILASGATLLLPDESVAAASPAAPSTSRTGVSADATGRLSALVSGRSVPNTASLVGANGISASSSALLAALALQAPEDDAAAGAEHRDEDADSDRFWRPAPRISPHVGGLQVVGVETWLAIDPATWKTLKWPKDDISYVAVPKQTVWAFSDKTITCDGPGVEYTPGAEGDAPCGRTWEHTTDVAEMQMEVTITYEVTWTTGADGEDDENEDYSDCYDVCEPGGDDDEGGEEETGTYEDSGASLETYDLTVGEIQTNGIDDLEPTPDNNFDPEGESVLQPDESEQGYEKEECSWDITTWDTCIEEGVDWVVDTVVGGIEWVFETAIEFLGQLRDLLPDWAGQILGVLEGCVEFGIDAVSVLLDGAKELLGALEDPIAWVEEKFGLFQEIYSAIQKATEDPVGFAEEFGSDLIDLELLEEDPAKWVGKIGCELAVTIFTGGAASTKVAKIVDKVEDIKNWVPDTKRRRGGGSNDRSDGDAGNGGGGDDGAAVCSRENSFPGRTPVLMADGTHAPINRIRPGDRILAANPRTGEWSPRTVEDQWSHLDRGTMATATLTDGSEITATDDHRFWVTNDGRWVELDDVRPGDRLLTPDGVTAVADVESSKPVTTVVWELDVEVDDTFAVHTGTDDVLVHNGKQCQPKTPGKKNLGATGGVKKKVPPDRNAPVSKKKPDTLTASDLTNPKLFIPPGKQFDTWFDQLDPQQFSKAYNDPAFKKTIKQRIRGNRGVHEWCVCSRAATFLEWDVPMSEIKRFTTKTDRVTWTNPNTGVKGQHVSKGRKPIDSKPFHDEIEKIVDSSTNIDQFNTKLQKLWKDWKVPRNARPAPLPHAN